MLPPKGGRGRNANSAFVSLHVVNDFDKTRFRFRKDGNLRLVSHHDLMRTLERTLRRAKLPFRSTSGFHPQPRCVFALSLPLGVIGWHDVLEIEWTEPVEPEEARVRINQNFPEGLTLLSARRIDRRVSARPRRAFYYIPVATERYDTIARNCLQIMDLKELIIERTRPHQKKINLRPYINNLTCLTKLSAPSTARTGSGLEFDLWIVPEGSARAEEVARAVGAGLDLEAGEVMVRSHLEIWDETCLQPGESSALPAPYHQPFTGELPLAIPQNKPEVFLEMDAKVGDCLPMTPPSLEVSFASDRPRNE